MVKGCDRSNMHGHHKYSGRFHRVRHNISERRPRLSIRCQLPKTKALYSRPPVFTLTKVADILLLVYRGPTLDSRSRLACSLNRQHTLPVVHQMAASCLLCVFLCSIRASSHFCQPARLPATLTHTSCRGNGRDSQAYKFRRKRVRHPQQGGQAVQDSADHA